MQGPIVAGDTLNFATTVADYSAAASWVLKFRLVPLAASGTAIELTSTAEGDDHRIQVTATTTAGWTTGTYTWFSWVEKGAEKYSVSSGTVKVQPNPRTSTGPLDLRSEAEIALEAARAAFYAWTPTQRRYRIGDREMEFSGTDDIVQVISELEAQVAREQNAAAMAKGLASKRITYVRLGR